MRWLADECVAAPLVALLRSDGHDVLSVAEVAAGLSDVDVVALALQEKRLLLTEDKDFGDLVFRRERAVPGLVLMRIDTDDFRLKAARLAAAIDQYGEGLFGRYMVIEQGRFRSRRVWSGL
jgi:predicted nuclease of predicted toxin-antitoxin system